VPGIREEGPVTSISRERVELRQPSANLLLGPVLLAVILLVAVIRELFVHPPSMIIIGVMTRLRRSPARFAAKPGKCSTRFRAPAG